MAKIHTPSFKEKSFFLISGMIISTPFSSIFLYFITYFLTMFTAGIIARIVSVSIIAPLLEEFAKTYPLYYRHGETEKSLITLGFLTGIGFAITEFIFYVFVFGAPFYFRLPALLFHASNTAIVSYGIAKKRVFVYFMIAVLLHAINNLSATIDNLWFLFGIGASLTSFLLAWTLYKRSSNQIIKTF